jgi:hypothetical protein
VGGDEEDNDPNRVFLHNQSISQSNIMELAENIYTQIIDHENDQIEFEYLNSFLGPHDLSTNDLDILDYGLLALDLLPNDYIPSMIYLTDGVSNTFGDTIKRETCQRIIRDFILFSLIQIGSGSGFDSSVSLGYIPNYEDMRFLVSALSGELFYADDLPYIKDGEIIERNFYHENFLFHAHNYQDFDSESEGLLLKRFLFN